jgi:hypothetical protein
LLSGRTACQVSGRGIYPATDSKTGFVPLSSSSYDHYHHLPTCNMAPPLSSSRPRLVGRPLLYSITAFASLGVFLVSHHFHSSICIHLPFSLDMIKGKSSYIKFASGRSSRCHSVMSGIITGPHFRKYFNSPGSLEVGTMVAVLEIGAFSTYSALGVPF